MFTQRTTFLVISIEELHRAEGSSEGYHLSPPDIHYQSPNIFIISWFYWSLVVMGDITILYQYCWFLSTSKCIDIFFKIWYFDTIYHMMWIGFTMQNFAQVLIADYWFKLILQWILAFSLHHAKTLQYTSVHV